MMRAYLYLTWEDGERVEDPEGYAMLKQAMLHNISDHIYQLGHKGMLFLTNESYERVSEVIKEKRGRPFMLIDITEGLSSKSFKTNVNMSEIKKRFALEESSTPMTIDGILDKMLNNGGFAALNQQERDYLDESSNS